MNYWFSLTKGKVGNITLLYKMWYKKTKKIKMKKAIMAVSLLFVLSSCSHDDDIVSEIYSEGVDSSQQKISYPTPQNVVVYEVDPVIMSHFMHYCQRHAGPPIAPYGDAEGILSKYMASASCGATSYMMAAGCIAKSSGLNYDVNGTTLKKITDKTGVSVNLTKPLGYGRNNDNFLQVGDNFGYYPSLMNPASPKIASDRANTKFFMQGALGKDQFLIVGVNVYANYDIVNDSRFYDTTNNPDLNDTGTVTTGSNKNYIKDRDESVYGVGGHIIVIIKITVNLSTFHGIVEYIDPLAKTRYDVNGNPLSNRRFVSYTRLLDSMSSNGNSSNYDVMTVGKK